MINFKKLLKLQIDMDTRFYYWGYPITKIIRWGINLRIRLHNKLYPEEQIPLIEKKND
jgi:hypothetical protein|tara:strand:- start:263 stop:436 length:174 start_codon:yes stop_codon:yes gene_type:complete